MSPSPLEAAFEHFHAGRLPEALAGFEAALTADPGLAEAEHGRALCLLMLGRDEEALAAFDSVGAELTGAAAVLANRGVALHRLGRLEEAVASYDAAVSADPHYAIALANRAATLSALGRHGEALESCTRALAVRPDHVDAWINRGEALNSLHRHAEGLESFERALALSPDHAEALNGRSTSLRRLGRGEAALADADRAVALRPGDPRLHGNRGMALEAIGRPEEALAAYDAGLALAPGFALLLTNRGAVLNTLGRHREALESFERALALGSRHPGAFGGAADAAAKLCDFEARERYASEMPRRSEAGVVAPVLAMGYLDDPGLLRKAAAGYVAGMIPAEAEAVARPARGAREKIRIAYLSADFRPHAVGFLFRTLLQHHDRGRFELIGLAFGPEDGGEVRREIARALDALHEIGGVGDRDAAGFLARLDVDIAVDLMGCTQHARPAIFAYRPAPVQVGFMGYAGTMGVRMLDYLIADPVVAPPEHAAHYAEALVHLPGSWLLVDGGPVEPAPDRAAFGLPKNGFVFAGFNAAWKITPQVFAAWMRLLRAVEDSVLWLSAMHPDAERSLRGEAARAGIDPGRLVIKPNLPFDAHLAAHGCADLFLDTAPYNAHATAGDAIRAGLPIVTCRGGAFAGRVGASLLTAAGLAELIAEDLAGYGALALALARDPRRLKGLRERLKAARFDAGDYARGLEGAFERMVSRGARTVA